MIVLGLETSGDTASLALCQGGRLLAGRAFPSRMNLCRDLAGEIKAVLDFLPDGEALGGIAVSLGPGSFTSLRIGVVTAKAMAHQMEIPLVGVPTPVALAAPLTHHEARTICAVQPGWKTAVYLTLIPPGDADSAERMTTPEAVQLDEIADRVAAVEGDLLLVGGPVEERRDELAEALGERAITAPRALADPSALYVVEAAMARLATADVRGAFEVTPLYVVPSQAERVAGIDLGLTGVEPSP